MKTSNKLLIAVTVILIGYLLVYNFALRAQYVKGEYKNRFYKMTHINVKDFTVINNNLGNVFGVDIEYGPAYGIWVNDEIKDAITFSKQGKTLKLYFSKKHRDYHYGSKAIIIICPVLDSVTLAAPQTNQLVNYWSANRITGFTQPAMKLNLKPYTKIELLNNNLTRLNATIEGAAGDSNFDNGFTITKNNTIKVANIKTAGDGIPHITLIDPAIDKVNYDLSDSTRLTVTGKLLPALKP